jgi:MOSC domain-containing protein YiiM
MQQVERIWLAGEHSAPMASVAQVEAVEGKGLRGDRYFRGTGFYSGFDECQVTFVAGEAIDHVRETFDIDLSDGRHRRNIVLRGVDVPALVDTRFRVGDAVFEGTRPRPPCAHVEDLAEEEGVARALGEERGGVCADVVKSGDVAVGNDVEVLADVGEQSDELAAAIRERHE